MTDCFKTAVFSSNQISHLFSCGNFNQLVWRSAQANIFPLGSIIVLMTVPIEAVQATRLHRATSISFSAIHSNQVAAKRHCVSPRTRQALSITHREWPVRSGQSYVQSVFLRDIVPGLHSWEMRFTGALRTNADRLQCSCCVLAIGRIVQSLDVWRMQCVGCRIYRLVLQKLYLCWLDLTGDESIFWLVIISPLILYIWNCAIIVLLSKVLFQYHGAVIIADNNIVLFI